MTRRKLLIGLLSVAMVSTVSAYAPSVRFVEHHTVQAIERAVSISSAVVTPGGISSLELTTSVSSPGIGGYTIDVVYDTTLVTATGCSTKASVKAGVCNGSYAPGTVRFVGTTAFGLSGSTNIGTITFLAGSSEGIAALGIHVNQLVDPEGNDITPGLNVTVGTIAIQGPTATRTLTATPAPTSTPTATPIRNRPPTPTSTPTPAGLAGDANKDGSVNAIDAALVLQYSAGLISSVNPNADANHNGEINAIDAAVILQYVAGFIHSLPP